MDNRKSYYVSVALALLLAGNRLVTAEVYVCGTDYANAATNCTVNTACPNGDGCSANETCYAMSEESCVGWTSLPLTIASTMPDLYVCGSDFKDALTNCHSEDDFCTDVTETTAYCKSIGDNVTRSCFIIPYGACHTNVSSQSPSVAVTTINPTTSSPTMSVSPTATESPTTSPLLFVCGSDYSDAASNFCTLTSCPKGDVSSCVCALSWAPALVAFLTIHRCFISLFSI